MTDKTHLEAFGVAISKPLSKTLVAAFTRSHRDPAVRPGDVVLLLKDEMERHLTEADDAAAQSDGP